MPSSVKLYCKGAITGYRRANKTQQTGTSLLAIEGVNDKDAAKFYCGKRVAYIYRASKLRKDSKVRVIWGRVTRPHGNSGAVRAQFRVTLPPRAHGASVRVMLYPSRV